MARSVTGGTASPSSRGTTTTSLFPSFGAACPANRFIGAIADAMESWRRHAAAGAAGIAGSMSIADFAPAAQEIADSTNEACTNAHNAGLLVEVPARIHRRGDDVDGGYRLSISVREAAAGARGELSLLLSRPYPHRGLVELSCESQGLSTSASAYWKLCKAELRSTAPIPTNIPVPSLPTNIPAKYSGSIFQQIFRFHILVPSLEVSAFEIWSTCCCWPCACADRASDSRLF